MSDIIQDAKRLLEGATPGPWIAADSDIIAPDNVFIGTVSEYSGLIDGSEYQFNTQLAAAAPELAQALAEENWEYAVQVKIGAKWLFFGRGVGGHNFAKNSYWFEKKEKAQWYKLIRQGTAPTRIIRRRVSPVEVVNE